ncbi:MAG: alpha/beta hydrolase [Azospirillaceae bacterium]|nr:alpha/beta hydrolase [Azospirillaceae bacterium]
MVELSLAPSADPITADGAPDWFVRALATPYEVCDVVVDGARIEARAWGQRGSPGLILLHGNAAHLGWWSFLAPFFARDHRVATLSFSGMGGSDWRPAYSTRTFVKEAWAVAEAAGILAAEAPPVVVGHSMGGMSVLHLAAQDDRPIRAGIIIDTALPGPELVAPVPRAVQRFYPDKDTGLARFRLSPPQPCANAWVMDHLADQSLREEPGRGWTWRFDPQLFRLVEVDEPWANMANAKVPLAILRGTLSEITSGAMTRRMRATAPAGTPFIEIPEAHHHVMADQPLALVSALRALLTAWT